MHARLIASLLVFLFCAAHCLAAEVQIAVTDNQGKALKNALVIVQDLDHQEREIFRVLTGDAGNIAPHSLTPGLYRAISTFPYSHFDTAVREFLVRNEPVKVELRMTAVEDLDDLPVSIGRLSVHVLDTNGQPAVGARVLLRDAYAHAYSEQWGTTDSQGTTTLTITGSPSNLVVVYRDRIYTFPANGVDTQRTLRLR